MNYLIQLFRLLPASVAVGSLFFQSAFAVLWHPDMTDAEARALGALPQFESRALINGCSAAMLNSEWAVSAAHCISYVDEQRVSLTYKKDGVPQTVFGTAYRVTNDLSNEDFNDDVMLIHLDTPITAAEGWVAPYDRFDEYDQLAWQIGVGTSGALGVNTAPGGQVHRGMTQRIYSTTNESITGAGGSVTPQVLYYNYNGSPEVVSPNAFTTRFEGGTGPGDSGGSLYVYSRGRFFSAGVVSGPSGAPFHAYRNARLSTHLNEMIAASGLEFAYPKNLTPKAVWVAEDLSNALSNSATVEVWNDRLFDLSWSHSEDGGTGSPVFVEAATPTGLAAVRFDGDDAMGLALTENPFEAETAMSVAMVVRSSGCSVGLETTAFGTTGVLDASVSGSDLGWGLSMAGNGRFGWSLDDNDNSVDSVFRGDVGNGSSADGEWHVVVATWDGSEILNDNAGDDLNMKLFVDSIEQGKRIQGPYHFNVGRAAVSLLLGNSRTNAVGGFNGDIAEIRLYSGELQLHEIDRLLTGLRARYVNGALGVTFERPWSSRLAVEAGQQLRTRGYLAGGGESMTWTVLSGPGAVTFSDVHSSDTEMSFEAIGTHILQAVVSDGVSMGTTDLIVDVVIPQTDASTMTPAAVEGNWISSDVGTTGVAGHYTESAGVFTLSGAGEGVGVDLGETYDEGHFVWKAVSGDFDWVARLDSIANSTVSPQAGMMVRGGPGPTDAAAFVGYDSAGTVRVLVRREGGWYADLTEDSGTSVSVPAYLKMERRGNAVSVYVSSDGLSYTSIVTDFEISLPGVARVGMFASSGNDNTANTAVFSDISLESVASAKASSAQFLEPITVSNVIEVIPGSDGGDEPWVTVDAVSGPAGLNFIDTFGGQYQKSQASTQTGGDYTLRVIADDGNTTTFIDRSVSVVFNERYEFESDGETEGWSGTNVATLTASNGSLSGTANTGDPQIKISGLNLLGESYTQVSLRMKADVNSAIQLFWTHAAAPGFSAARSLSLDYTDAGSFQTVTFDMAGLSEWGGESITGLRIDPLSGSVAGEDFEIEWIEISDGLPVDESLIAYRFDEGGNFEQWNPAKDITESYVLGSALHGKTSGNDSILTNDVEDFNSDGIEGMMVCIRASLDGRLDFFWATVQSPGFSGTRRVQVEYSGDDTWQIIHIPLGGNPEWDGQLITHLRIDPTHVASAAFAIDLIAASAGDYDEDLMPDAFESMQGLNPLSSADALLDLDADGFSNLDEYIAGTSLSLASERIAVKTFSSSASGVELTVEGKSGRLYQLVRKNDLTDSVWTPVDSEGPLSSDSIITLEDTTDLEKVFYRIEVSYP